MRKDKVEVVPNGTEYGYARVSTRDQNEARQIERFLKDHNCTKIFLDKQSGKNKNRPQLQEMISLLKYGDTVVVESFSRLSRSLSDLIKLSEQFEEKGVILYSKKEGHGSNSATDILIRNVLGSVYEFEREIMLERQAEGIAIAKRDGRYKGRKPLDYDKKLFVKLYTQWKAGEITAKFSFEKLGMSSPTFYRRVAEFEIEQANTQATDNKTETLNVSPEQKEMLLSILAQA